MSHVRDGGEFFCFSCGEGFRVRFPAGMPFEERVGLRDGVLCPGCSADARAYYREYPGAAVLPFRSRRKPT
jgi:hypothetical protein